MADMSLPPTLSLAANDPARLLGQLVETRFLPDRTPEKMRIARERRRAVKDWRAVLQELSDEPFELAWDEGRRLLQRGTQGILRVTLEPEDGAVAIPAALEQLDFEVAVVAPLFGTWRAADPDYQAPRIGPGHYDLGWGCAFKGEGHRHLTSRRWLDQGPWKLIRGANDLSFVQFHALDAEPEQALAQARPGHEALADPQSGGLVYREREVSHTISGTYEAAGRVLKVPVLGRKVSSAEMMDYRWAERHGLIETPGPLERIAFVFLEEDEAAPHLHELWSRGFECWVVRSGQEVRIDDDYEPPERRGEPPWSGP